MGLCDNHISNMANPFAEYTTNISNAAGVAKIFVPGITQNIISNNVPIGNAVKLVFNPEVRSYFDVTHSLVGKKIKNVVLPFFKQQQMEEVRKPELYLPLISLMTFILFSAFADGLRNHTSGFNPNIGKKLLLCLLLTILEVIAAKCTRFAMSSIQMGVLDLTSFMSYRFVGLALSSITYSVFSVFGIPYINKILLAYFVLAETYFYYSELKTYLQERIVNTRDLSNSTLTLIHLVVSAVLVFLL